MPKTAEEDDDHATKFTNWLREFGHGKTAGMLGVRMREVVQACELTGKKGKLVLTFDVSAMSGIAEIHTTIKTTKPEPALLGGMFYISQSGELVTEDPRQLKLPGKVLDVPERPLKTIPFADASKPDKKGD